MSKRRLGHELLLVEQLRLNALRSVGLVLIVEAPDRVLHLGLPLPRICSDAMPNWERSAKKTRKMR